MNGKDLEKALLWEAPHIGEKAPEQIPEAQDFCEGYKEFLNEGKTERECVKKVFDFLINTYSKETNNKFYPEQIFKDSVCEIENYPSNIKYSDMGVNTNAEKSRLLEKWKY